MLPIEAKLSRLRILEFHVIANEVTHAPHCVCCSAGEQSPLLTMRFLTPSEYRSAKKLPRNDVNCELLKRKSPVPFNGTGL